MATAAPRVHGAPEHLFLIFSHIPKVACSANAIFLFRDQHVRIWSSVNSECLAASTRTVNSRHYGRADKTYSGGLTHSLVRKQKKQSTAIYLYLSLVCHQGPISNGTESSEAEIYTAFNGVAIVCKTAVNTALWHTETHEKKRKRVLRSASQSTHERRVTFNTYKTNHGGEKTSQSYADVWW